MPNLDIFEAKADFMRILAHPLRVEIVELLQEKTMNVNEICTQLNKEQTTVSKHLSILKNGGILKSEKTGLNVFYSVDICCLPNFLGCLNSILQERMTKISKKSKKLIKSLK